MNQHPDYVFQSLNLTAKCLMRLLKNTGLSSLWKTEASTADSAKRLRLISARKTSKSLSAEPKKVSRT